MAFPGDLGVPYALLVPTFSVGCTREWLHEPEGIIHRNRARSVAKGVPCGEAYVVVDSPLAADRTAGYGRLKQVWNGEPRSKVDGGRHRLVFE